MCRRSRRVVARSRRLEDAGQEGGVEARLRARRVAGGADSHWSAEFRKCAHRASWRRAGRCWVGAVWIRPDQVTYVSAGCWRRGVRSGSYHRVHRVEVGQQGAVEWKVVVHSHKMAYACCSRMLVMHRKAYSSAGGRRGQSVSRWEPQHASF